MTKPVTLHDLLMGDHVTLRDVDDIARAMFDGNEKYYGLSGYVLTASSYDNLPEHVRAFVRKAVFSFSVENVFDAVEEGDVPQKPLRGRRARKSASKDQS